MYKILDLKKESKAIQNLVVSISVLLMIFLLMAVGVSYLQIKSTLNQKTQDYSNNLSQSLETSIEESFKLLQSNTELLKANLALEQAFQQQDKPQLLKLSEPIFQHSLLKHAITHFYYHQTNQRNLLRVHAPNNNQDLITRQTLANRLQHDKTPKTLNLEHWEP